MTKLFLTPLLATQRTKIVKTKAQGLCTDKGGEGKEKYSINLFKKGGQYVRGI